MIKYTYKVQKKSGLFVSFGQFLGSWIGIRIPNLRTGIRIQANQIRANPDPRHRWE